MFGTYARHRRFLSSNTSLGKMIQLCMLMSTLAVHRPPLHPRHPERLHEFLLLLLGFRDAELIGFDHLCCCSRSGHRSILLPLRVRVRHSQHPVPRCLHRSRTPCSCLVVPCGPRNVGTVQRIVQDINSSVAFFTKDAHPTQ